MKILILGLGSIGRRHLKVLQELGGHEIAALRSRKGTLTDNSNIKEFNSLQDALAFKPQGVIVSNPTSLHVQTALPFLQAGCKVLIEKPIAHTSKEARLLEEYKDQIKVAYCMRFLPHSQFFLNELNLDEVFKISFKRSFYLPKWHPYADYRKEYTAIKSLGGGIIRTLSHEIDLAVCWMGQPIEVNGLVDKLSKLDLNVDDFAQLSLKMKNGGRVNLEMDFFSPFNVNEGELLNDKGKYHWNLKGLYFCPYSGGVGEEIINFEEVFDQMYIHQMRDFINFIEGGISQNSSYQDALLVNEIIDSIEAQSSYINKIK